MESASMDQIGTGGQNTTKLHQSSAELQEPAQIREYTAAELAQGRRAFELSQASTRALITQLYEKIRNKPLNAS